MTTGPSSPKHAPWSGWLALYYLGILLVVTILHVRTRFTAPPFVYQGF